MSWPSRLALIAVVTILTLILWGGAARELGRDLLGVAVYFLPTIAAAHHPRRRAIFVLNLVGGWTILGWIAALVWACVHSATPPRPEPKPAATAGGAPSA